MLVGGSADADESNLAPVISNLGSPDRSARMAAVRELADSGDARAARILEAMVAGQLYVQRKDGVVAIGRRQGSGYQLTDPLTDAPLGRAGRRDVSRVALNSEERDAVRRSIVELELSVGDPAARREALDVVMAQPNSIPLDAIRARLESEPDSGARQRLEALEFLAMIESGDSGQQSAAVRAMAGYSYPAVRTRLEQIVDDPNTPQGVRDDAALSLSKIDARQTRVRLLQTVFFGLSLGSVLVLAAIGLAITFGVMGVINMAHGELIMLGAYTSWGMQVLLPDAIGLALLLSVPAAFAVSAAVGILIERTVVRHLYRRPAETLLATFGVSLILQQSVRSLFGPLNRTVAAPDWMSGSLELFGGLTLTWNRIAIILFCLLVFSGVLALIRYTRFGLELRAVAQDRRTARTLGVRSGRIDALTFGLGAGIAGIAGVALSQLTNVGPNLGQAYIIDSFLVVVVGGVGNLWGTLVAGLSIGMGNKLLEPVAGAVLAKILLLIAIILFIQKRPRGLFPQRGRVADT
jgi:urea transport system permease protein